MVGAGELGPDADWYESSTDSGWIHSQAPQGDRKVVFLGGLHFQYRRFSVSGQHLKESSTKWTFRGADDDKSVHVVNVSDDESWEVTCTEVGKLNIPMDDEEGSDEDC